MQDQGKSRGATFLGLLFAPCSEISLQTSMSLDTKLPRSHRIAIALHCCYCKACRRYRHQIYILREFLRASGEKPPLADGLAGISMSADARERIRKSVADQSE